MNIDKLSTNETFVINKLVAEDIKSLSDAELERIFEYCVNPAYCVRVVHRAKVLHCRVVQSGSELF